MILSMGTVPLPSRFVTVLLLLAGVRTGAARLRVAKSTVSSRIYWINANVEVEGTADRRMMTAEKQVLAKKSAEEAMMEAKSRAATQKRQFRLVQYCDWRVDILRLRLHILGLKVGRFFAPALLARGCTAPPIDVPVHHHSSAHALAIVVILDLRCAALRRDAMPDFTIRDAIIPEELAIVSGLFTAYTTWLNVDLAFQDYAAELSSLPGKYARPGGRILIAVDDSLEQQRDEEMVLGCIALRAFGKGENVQACEMKRLYTVPKARCRGVGRALVMALVHEARKQGYTRMLLDTLGHMHSAIRLYESCGFTRVPAYYNNPLEDVVYFSLNLETAGPAEGKDVINKGQP